MKNQVKLIGLALCCIIIILSTFSALADEEKIYHDGLIVDESMSYEWESLDGYNPPDDSESKIISYRFGDMNGDGSITAGDARVCLQAAAKLTVLNEYQRNAANILGSENITSSTARKILRIAAKLETLSNGSGITVHLMPGEKYEIGPLNFTLRQQWRCSVSSTDSVAVSEIRNANTQKQYFSFLIHEPGTYSVCFQLYDNSTAKVYEEFDFEIIED